jgi:hypothetical protein
MTEHEDVLAEMNAAMDEAMATALAGGDVDDLFEVGVKIGLTIAIGLSRAHGVKERALRDAAEWAQAGQGTEYQRHLARAQAFEELADKLRQWHAEHPPPSRPTRSESDVPDSPLILLTLGMQLPDGSLHEVVRRVPLYAVDLAADGHAALFKVVQALAKDFKKHGD